MQIPKGVYFSHLRNLWYPGGYPEILSRGGLTVCYTQDTDADGGPFVRVAVAYCHENDNYNKRYGRIKSFGQLMRLVSYGDRVVSEETVGGQPRFFLEPGLVQDVMPGLLAQLEKETGFLRIRKPDKNDRVVL